MKKLLIASLLLATPAQAQQNLALLRKCTTNADCRVATAELYKVCETAYNADKRASKKDGAAIKPKPFHMVDCMGLGN